MKNKTKHILDLVMSVMLLFLMAYQVTGEKVHEWLGIATTQEHVLPAALGCCTKLDKGYMLHTLKKNTYRILW